MVINKEKVELFFEYNDFGYNGRFIPDRFKEFSDSKEFAFLDDIFQRLLLEKQTKVADSYRIETQRLIDLEIDSELSQLLKEYVKNYPRKNKKPWWKFW